MVFIGERSRQARIHQAARAAGAKGEATVESIHAAAAAHGVDPADVERLRKASVEFDRPHEHYVSEDLGDYWSTTYTDPATGVTKTFHSPDPEFKTTGLQMAEAKAERIQATTARQQLGARTVMAAEAAGFDISGEGGMAVLERGGQRAIVEPQQREVSALLPPEAKFHPGFVERRRPEEVTIDIKREMPLASKIKEMVPFDWGKIAPLTGKIEPLVGKAMDIYGKAEKKVSRFIPEPVYDPVEITFIDVAGAGAKRLRAAQDKLFPGISSKTSFLDLMGSKQAKEFTEGFGYHLRKEIKDKPIKYGAVIPAVGFGIGASLRVISTTVAVPKAVSIAGGLGLTGLYAYEKTTKLQAATTPKGQARVFAETGLELTGLTVGGALGLRAADVGIGLYRTRGMKELALESIVQEDVLFGRKHFETSMKDHLKLFQESPFQLPGRPIGSGVWHAMGTAKPSAMEDVMGLRVGGRAAVLTQPRGHKEFLPGAFVARGLSPLFLRISKGYEYKAFGFDVMAGNLPTVAHITPKGIRAFRRTSVRGFTDFLTGKAEPGFAYTHPARMKSEVEALIPPGTQLRMTAADYFVKFRGVRVPVKEFLPTGAIKPSRNIFGRAFRSSEYRVSRAVALSPAAMFGSSLLSKSMAKRFPVSSIKPSRRASLMYSLGRYRPGGPSRADSSLRRYSKISSAYSRGQFYGPSSVLASRRSFASYGGYSFPSYTYTPKRFAITQPPPPPPWELDILPGRRKMKVGKVPQRKFKYAPSLVALGIGLKAKVKPQRLTGLRIRGI